MKQPYCINQGKVFHNYKVVYFADDYDKEESLQVDYYQDNDPILICD